MSMSFEICDNIHPSVKHVGHMQCINMNGARVNFFNAKLRASVCNGGGGGGGYMVL